MGGTRNLGKKKGDITRKLRKGEQSFLCLTHRIDTIHIIIKLHEDIYNSYNLLSYGGYKNFLGKNQSKGNNSEIKKRGTITLVHDTSS